MPGRTRTHGRIDPLIRGGRDLWAHTWPKSIQSASTFGGPGWSLAFEPFERSSYSEDRNRPIRVQIKFINQFGNRFVEAYAWNETSTRTNTEF